MELNTALNLARDLLKQHSLEHWNLKLNHCKRQAGRCIYYTHSISLSQPFIQANDLEEVRDTILHEIAHALIPPGHGHNYFWQCTARRIGARPERFAGPNAKHPIGKWQAICPICGKRFQKYRKLRRIYYCSKCYRTHLTAAQLTFQEVRT